MSNVNPQLLKTALEMSTIITRMIQFSQKMFKDIIYKILRQLFSIGIRNNDWKHKKPTEKVSRRNCGDVDISLSKR